VSQSHKVLALDPDGLYTVEELHASPLRKARIHASVTCAECGEAAMETRVRRLDGRELRQRCFDAALSPEQPVGARARGAAQRDHLSLRSREGSGQVPRCARRR
jgi:hypothetical protein